MPICIFEFIYLNIGILKKYKTYKLITFAMFTKKFFVVLGIVAFLILVLLTSLCITVLGPVITNFYFK